MNKKVIVFLTLFLAVVLSGCNTKKTVESGEYNTISEETKQQMVVALNPQITYSDGKTHNAYSDITASLTKDLKEDSMTLYQDTCWRWMYYDEGTSEWAERDSVSKSAWQNWKQENKSETPYSYTFTTDGTTALTPYKTSAVNLLSYEVGTEPTQGIIMSVTGEYEEGLCYIAPEDGTVAISDPNGGNVSVLRRVSGIQTFALDNDKYDRWATIIVYHNGVPIWSNDFYNPNYVGQLSDGSGSYSVAFPKLENIAVKKGDLISIVIENNTDLRTPLDMIPGEYKEYVEASELVLDEGGNYISVQGAPYLLNGMQIRPDRVMEQFIVGTDEQYAEYIEPLFQNCAEMGYETVIFPIEWRQIELVKDKYSSGILQRYYDYAEKYDLKVQLLWFGSDVCGYSTRAPKYILEDTETYSRLEKLPDVINYGDMDLVEREIAAFKFVLEWLYENDKDCRTVAIQIENEPNNEAFKGPVRTSDTDEESIDETTWCAGQREDIYNILNALGMMVKTGPYRCVTRVNFITHQCWYNGVKNHELTEVVELDGIDIVGCDSYQENTDPFLLTTLDIAGNIPHWPEFGANHSNYLPATLIAMSKRAGSLGYHLKANQVDKFGVITAIDNTWTWPTGEKYETSSQYHVDAYELKAMNTVLNKASEQIAVNDVSKTQVFNIARATSCSETAEIDGIKITFANNGASNFGGCGYATAISDNEMLIFATRGNSSFQFAGKNIVSAEAGAYVDGTWKTDKQITASGNSVSISSEMAKEGTLIRVTFK